MERGSTLFMGHHLAPEPCPLGIPLPLLSWLQYIPREQYIPLVAETGAHLPTLLHSAIPTEMPYSDCLQHLVNLGSEPPFITAIFHPRPPPRPLQQRGCIVGCVQSCYWCTICPLPLLFLLSVSTWIALPSHRPCHF